VSGKGSTGGFPRDWLDDRLAAALECLGSANEQFNHCVNGQPDGLLSTAASSSSAQASTQAMQAAHEAVHNAHNAIRTVLTEEAEGIYTVPMLSPSFCNMLLDELAAYEQSGLPVQRPNTMNNFGLIVNSIGMTEMMDALQVSD
jgi:hypothetical protein